MTQESGAAAGTEALLNEGGPWGGNDGEGPKSPWSQPPRKRPGTPGTGPSALDALIRRGRALLGGNGPHLDVGRLWRWAILAVLLLWVALTCCHTIGPQERGVVTRFGKYVGTLQPGLGFTLPAPIDLVTKLDVDNIHVSEINGNAEGQSGQNGQNLMLTGDENIIDLQYSVRWNVRDPELYLFQLQDPEGTVREATESAMREAIARVSMADAIGPQRSAIEAKVASRTQEILDGYHSGVLIQGVAIKQADPPAEVMDAFKEVSAAQQTAQSYMNQARAYATQVTAKAEGEAAAFDKVYAQYALAPEVTRRRMYYETMEKVLAKTDKTIVQAPVTSYLPIQPAQRAQAAK